MVGPNGSGKTNLLEALYVLSRGKSFRVSDVDLLKYKSEWTRLDSKNNGKTRTIILKNDPNKIKKEYRINDTTKMRLMGREKLPVVLFEPRDMELLTGSPERRRTYVDAMLEQMNFGYSTLLSRYKRALTQRNYLLKQQTPASPDNFFVWNVRLSELGAKIISARRDLVTRLNQKSSELYGHISKTKGRVDIKYIDQFSGVESEQLASKILAQFEVDAVVDAERGFTRTGPHRDDIAIVLNGANAATSASRGETRSLVVMLKLLEADLITSQLGYPPLMLLDDVFGELDLNRRAALADFLKEFQTIITSTDAEMSSSIARDFSVIDLKS